MDFTGTFCELKFYIIKVNQYLVKKRVLNEYFYYFYKRN
ncbi:hypothetical protein EMIT036CA2_11245 [Chryseobacterium sp. IT-36CA2]